MHSDVKPRSRQGCALGSRVTRSQGCPIANEPKTLSYKAGPPTLAGSQWPATLDGIRKGCVVKPFHDPSVFEEEHACAMPGLDLEASEVVNPLVNYHWSASPGFEYLEALHVIHEALNLVLHSLPSFGSFHRFERAIGAVICEVGHDLADIVSRPCFAEILDYLNVGFFLIRRLSGSQR